MTIHLEFPSEGRADEVETNKAIELLWSGVARLHADQRIPPVAFVSGLINRSQEIAAFGESAASSSNLDKLSSSLTPSGVLQNMVKGKEVPWLSSGVKLISGAKSKLGLVTPDGISHFAAAESVLMRYLKDNLQPDTGRIAYLAERHTESRHNQRQCVSPEWEAYRAQLQRLREDVFAGIQRGLLEARILCAQTSNGQSSLLHPNQAAQVRFKSARDGLSFCFTKDLPKALFASEQPLHKIRREAAEFMKKKYQHFREKGRYASSKDLKTVAIERFGLSKNGANEAWNTIKSDLRTESGNKKEALKVSIQEIRALE